MPCIAFFHLIHWIFCLIYWLLKIVPISLLNCSFCLCIVFLISLNCLSVFSCSSPSFLKIAILNSMSIDLQSQFLWYWLQDDYCDLLFSWFHIYILEFALLFLNLKQQSPLQSLIPAFTGRTHWSCYIFWDFLQPFMDISTL